jgi:hypothetical protein
MIGSPLLRNGGHQGSKERERNNLSKIKLKALVKDAYNVQVMSLSVLKAEK